MLASVTSVKRPAVRSDLRALEGYHSPQLAVPVRLNTNESPFPPPREFTTALAAEIARIEWHRYPDRAAIALRRAIADHHGVATEQVFVGNGSNEVLQTILLAYAGHGRRVLTFEPTYQLHGHIARLTGAEVVEHPRDAEFRLDAAAAEAAVREVRPAVTFLCSPNNPTGLVEPPDLVQRVSDAESGLVVVDEAYGQFASWSAQSLLDEDRPLAVVRTFSKTWSMAALRLGYVLAPTWLVASLDAVALPYHVDAVKQIAGRLALHHRAAMAERVRAVVGERERVIASMSRLSVDVVPSDANFVLFRPQHGNGSAVWSSLVERGVLVRDCSSWPRLAGCLRVTVGTPDENDVFLAALGAALAPDAVPAGGSAR